MKDAKTPSERAAVALLAVLALRRAVAEQRDEGLDGAGREMRKR